jgi:hypothetical protein
METLAPQQENHLQVSTPDSLLTLAIQNNLDIDKLERLLAMKERWDKEQARKDFVLALSEFQEECPELRKNKDVKFKSDGPVVYTYAPLPDIDRQIKGLLKKHGFTKRWRMYDVAGKTKVVCVLTHKGGHSEETEMEGESDTSGQKSAMQAKGASITFMQRYTLIGALGLTTADSDIDGRMDYQYDVDKLHNQFMEVYNKIIQIDASKSTWHPDNWVLERNGKNYVKAIGDARKILAQLSKPKR